MPVFQAAVILYLSPRFTSRQSPFCSLRRRFPSCARQFSLSLNYYAHDVVGLRAFPYLCPVIRTRGDSASRAHRRRA
jgi:hypothetical protein